ncbi:CdaR family protein [Sutcliffiella deserti]|uniref:CdaR family protein n=1 Tax=Sutcliffiella deserti TaxID=2875501 RepID=UPI001CBBEB1E|nr:CdaR family protein [Sutcliffiella deserti]
MDNFIGKRWIMKIIALLLALMLYMSVNIEITSTQQQRETSPSPFPSASTDTETVTDVPVSAYYDRDTQVVTGLPQSVTITLEGPTSTLKPTVLQKDFEVYLDLTNLELGTHQVPLQWRNLSERLDVTIEPAVASITIEEKVTEDFPVEVDFINRGLIEEGYEPEKPIVKPNSVKVTGSKELIDRIALVKARVDLEGVNESLEEQSGVTVYDSEGNTLNVEVEPAVVDVSVPITSPNKKVPLRINRQGSLQENLSILQVEAEPKEVTVYGPKGVLDELEYIGGIDLDLSDITESTTIEVNVPVPDGARRVEPEKVNIRVEVEQEEEKTFTNLPIQYIGLSDSLELEMIDPEDGVMDLTVLGAPSVLEGVTSSDMEIYINVTDLAAGEHEVPLEINGPQDVSWNLPERTMKFRLSEIIE